MARKKIGIVGGGQIGGILALLATQKDLGDVVILDIPDLENVMKGKALDIAQLAPHDGYDAKLTGTGNYADLAGSDVIVITAGVARKPGMTREDLLNVNLNIIKAAAEGIKKHAPKAFCIVITNPLDAMVYAFQKFTGFPRSQVVGMAGALDTARFRIFVAMETGFSVEDIQAPVLGGHGPTMVPLWRLATVGGVPLAEVLPREKIDAIANRTREAGTEIVKLYGTGSAYFSPAAAAIEMAEAFLKDKKRVIASCALCQGEYGINGYFIGVPTVIGAGGVEKILEIRLNEDEKAALMKTFEEVKKTVAEARV